MTNKNTRSKKCIFIPRGEQPARLYHAGKYISEFSEGIFSYNMRDEWDAPHRESLTDVLFDLVEKAFNSDDFSRTHAVRYWEAAQAQQEAIETIRPINTTSEVTRKHLFDGFHKVFGKQACVYTDFQFASHAEAMGWKIVSLRDGPARVAMHAGVKSDLVMVKTLDDPEILSPSDLTEKEKNRLYYTQMILNVLGSKHVIVMIVKEFTTDGFVRVGNQGVFRKDVQDILITRETLKDAMLFLAVALHEHGHYISQATDGSSAFVGYFIMQWMSAMHKHNEVVSAFIQELLES